MYKVQRHHSFVEWERQNLKKSEGEENGETKIEEKQASPLVSRTHTCFLYLTQYISYLTDVHESHAEYYYLARSSLPHLLSHPTDWRSPWPILETERTPVRFLLFFSSNTPCLNDCDMCICASDTILVSTKVSVLVSMNVVAISGSKIYDFCCLGFFS